MEVIGECGSAPNAGEIKIVKVPKGSVRLVTHNLYTSGNDGFEVLGSFLSVLIGTSTMALLA